MSDEEIEGDLDKLRHVYEHAVEERRDMLWEDCEWQPPLEEKEKIRDVTDEFLNESSDREWAMYIAGQMAAYQMANNVVDSLREQKEEEEDEE